MSGAGSLAEVCRTSFEDWRYEGEREAAVSWHGISQRRGDVTRHLCRSKSCVTLDNFESRHGHQDHADVEVNNRPGVASCDCAPSGCEAE